MSSTTLLCFPPAGAGAGFFRPWIGHNSDLRIVPVEFPGRGKRFTEPECTDMDSLLEVIVPELLETVVDADRVAVFGHCFGAIVGYKAAQAMARRSPDLDLTLVASGSTGPGVPGESRITGLPDDEFVARVQRISGYRHPSLDEPELRELVLPPLRTDVAMHESHAFDTSELLTVPVLAVRGSHDDMVSAEDAGTWRTMATGRFRLAEIEGGHMYLVDHWKALLQLVADEMRAVPAAS
ncbi:thioesterase II family protein [Streptomyces sp. NBC_00151]|jgi:surfactin synthase thioesterase subunit|uniref:thioesterase II family protein n=1 Tax=Streptomyces sp. NBC_00151 TaxID=2975669 RepID=UPI002DD8719E|nr:alpha/beta fold hydrolase [Streptomyces sp. NBC_00151]WRZ40368.1 alpha/beta fold hydrolase [Streptomyces sp. NBC_00151]